MSDADELGSTISPTVTPQPALTEGREVMPAADTLGGRISGTYTIEIETPSREELFERANELAERISTPYMREVFGLPGGTNPYLIKDAFVEIAQQELNSTASWPEIYDEAVDANLIEELAHRNEIPTNAPLYEIVQFETKRVELEAFVNMHIPDLPKNLSIPELANAAFEAGLIQEPTVNALHEFHQIFEDTRKNVDLTSHNISGGMETQEASMQAVAGMERNSMERGMA